MNRIVSRLTKLAPDLRQVKQAVGRQSITKSVKHLECSVNRDSIRDKTLSYEAMF